MQLYPTVGNTHQHDGVVRIMSKNYDGAFLRNYKIAKSSNQREKIVLSTEK